MVIVVNNYASLGAFMLICKLQKWTSKETNHSHATSVFFSNSHEIKTLYLKLNNRLQDIT